MYAYTLQDLLVALEPFAPIKVSAVSANHRRVDHGLLTVGLKLHSFGGCEAFRPLIEELGGWSQIIEVNHYRRSSASFTLVLPPVGNARTAVQLLECIEAMIDIPIFGSKHVQIQVCSPGRLSSSRAAMLAILFYLGSDVLRRYTLEDFETTYSSDKTLVESLRPFKRGSRLVLYDAPWGKFDKNFEWWRRRATTGRLWRKQKLPFGSARTDVLSAKSRIDIHNINLAATLLCHSQYAGFWAELGVQLEERLQKLLHDHLLDELLYASWLHTEEEVATGDQEFMLALDQLMTYAIQDSFHSKKGRAVGRRGILVEVKQLFDEFRRLLVADSTVAQVQE